MCENIVNIWIVNPYGTLPSEGWREYRSALLARALAARGHRVIWWIADFEHRSKAYRAAVDHDPLLPASVAIRCLPTPSYQRHISPGRIRFEHAFGRCFTAEAAKMERPDVIVLAEPSLFFGVPVRRFAAKRDIPFVIDIIDLWPELFHILLPGPFKRLGNVIFAPLYSRRRKLARQAAGIAAVTGDYRYAVAGRLGDKPTGVFYWGVDFASFQKKYPNLPPLHETAGWAPGFIGATLVYAGTLGEAYDIATACQAARLLCERNAPARFVFAGDGPLRSTVEQLAHDYPDRVYFAGSVSPDQLVPLYQQSDIGLCSYAPGSTVSMPIKIFDYLAAGLAVLSSLGGEISQIVKSGVGLQYEAGSADSLADAISLLTRDPTKLAQMKTRSGGLGEQFDNQRQYGAFAEFIETAAH